MAKITRATHKVFGATGTVDNFNQFGSAVTGTPVNTKDISSIQQLTKWSTGWQDAVVGTDKAPVMEEMNSAMYEHSYQTGYILQEGIPEWDSGTTYYTNSIVKLSGTYDFYASLVDNNTNNAPPSKSSNANWKWINDPTVYIPYSNIRQTVLSGGVDSNGQANFCSPQSGLILQMVCTTPVVVSYAAGFNAYGPLEYISRHTATMTVTVPASQTSYIYLLNDGAGNVTLNYASTVPTYGYAFPGSPSANDFFFRIPEMKMYQYVGGSWVQKIAVFIAECVAGSGSISSVTTYALRGEYMSAITNTIPANATTISFAHNLGVNTEFYQSDFYIKNITTEVGWATGTVTKPLALVTGDGTIQAIIEFNSTRNGTYAQIGNNGTGLQITNTSGTSSQATKANWAYFMKVKRTF